MAALQLHPDKNKHPMAEVAFKLLSEVSLQFLVKIVSFTNTFTRLIIDHGKINVIRTCVKVTHCAHKTKFKPKYRIEGEHNQER